MQEVAFIYLSPFLRPRPPCLKGAVTEGDWGVVVLSLRYFVTPPSSEGGFSPAIILQITLFVSVKEEDLYRRIYFQ